MSIFFLLLFSVSLTAQLPTYRELEAEVWVQEVYRALGGPGSQSLSRKLGTEHLRFLLEGLVQGYFTRSDAERILVEILLERGTMPQGAFLPPILARGLKAQDNVSPLVFFEALPPPSGTPERGIVIPATANPLIRIPPMPEPTTLAPAPSVAPVDIPARIVEGPADPPLSPTVPRPPVRNMTDQDFIYMVGPVGVQTSGGSRGQRAQELFSANQLLEGARSIMRNNGRFPTDNRTHPGIAAVQLLLLAVGIDLAQEGLDGFASSTNKTSEHLRRFQDLEGLAVSGLLTQETWQALLNRAFRPRRP